MPDTGHTVILAPINTNPSIPPTDIPDLDPIETLAELTKLIRSCGQNPITQLAGYLTTDDPTFLPESGQARALARRIGRDKLLETLIKLYLTSTTPAPTSDNT